MAYPSANGLSNWGAEINSSTVFAKRAERVAVISACIVGVAYLMPCHLTPLTSGRDIAPVPNTNT